MNNKEVISTLSDIRNMMEKSSRFLSLNGLSAIFVGIFACIGAIIAHFLFGSSDVLMLNINTPLRLKVLIFFALILITICIGIVILLSHIKAKKAGQCLKLDHTAKRLLWNFFFPLAIGGILYLSLIWQQYYGLTSSVMLIFYGIALINASNHTYSNTRYLGYAEIILGLADSFIQGYALLFWVIGFGFFHIIYGVYFYLKYDRK